MKKRRAAVILLLSLLVTIMCACGFLRAGGDASAQYAVNASGETALLSRNGVLSKFDRNGVLLWKWEPEENGEYAGLVFDRSGTFFFWRQEHSRQVDAQGEVQDVILKEEILALSGDGQTFNKVLTVNRSTLSTPSGEPYLCKLQPHEDQLLAVCRQENGYGLLSLDPYNGAEPLSAEGYRLPDGEDEAAGTAVLGEALAVSTASGKLWLLSSDGTAESLTGLAGDVWADGLSTDTAGNLYFTDLKGGAYYQLNPESRSITRLYNPKDSVVTGENTPVFSDLRGTVRTSDGGYTAVLVGGKRPVYCRFGDTGVMVNRFWNRISLQYLLILLGVFAGTALLSGGVWALFAQLGRSNILGGRILRRYVPMCVVVFAVAGGIFCRFALSAAEKSQSDSLAAAARLASLELQNIGRQTALPPEAAERAALIVGREDIGILVYTLANGNLWCTQYTKGRDQFYSPLRAVPASYELGGGTAEKILALQNGGTLRFYRNGTAYCGYFTPVQDKNGAITGYVEARAESSAALNSRVTAVLIAAAVLAAASACLLCCLLALTLRKAFRPLRELNRCIREIGAGNWNVKAEITSKDELADISASFNGMAEKLNQYIVNMTLLNNEYIKYVPRGLFQLLGKSQVTELALGDQCVRDLTLLFISFQPEGAADDSAAYFEMLGRHLDRLFDTAEKNRGIIERFDGSGIVALFPEGTEDAVNTAIAAKELLADAPLAERMKMVISVSPTLIGVAGGEKRQSIVAISDAVLRIYEVSGLMDELGVRCVLTKRAMDSISADFYFQYREVGSGGTSGESLYEFLDGMEPYEKKLRLVTKENFERGVHAFGAGQYPEARRYFMQVLQVNEQDSAAVLYLVLCDGRQKEHTAEGLQGP